MSGVAWVNGRLVKDGGSCLSLRERGFLYGDGLFETVRVYGGKPFALERHLERLSDGCGRLEIPYPGGRLAEGIRQLLAAVGRLDGSLRVTVTRGEAPRGLLVPPGIEPTVAITFGDGEPYPPAVYGRGFRAVTVSFPRNHRSPLVRLKSLNYLENLLGKQEAAAAGAEEGIFLNLRGEVAEGTISNIFLVMEDRQIVTPPPESGLLPGITRELVIALAGGIGYRVWERPVYPGDFLKAREAFLTNSLLEVMPLVALDGAPIGNGGPGPVATELRETYRERVVGEVNGY